MIRVIFNIWARYSSGCLKANKLFFDLICLEDVDSHFDAVVLMPAFRMHILQLLYRYLRIRKILTALWHGLGVINILHVHDGLDTDESGLKA